MAKKILFVDNDPEHRELYQRLLENVGYQVMVAESVEQAIELIKEYFFHLVISDIRLSNDNNPDDQTGLELINDPRLNHITKMVITAYTNFENARKALKYAFDIVDKDDPKNVLKVVARAFEVEMVANWNLEVRQGIAASYSQIAYLLHPERDHLAQVEVADALEFLFRSMFARYKQIHLDRVLWQAEHRVALIVHFFHDRGHGSRVVVCGKTEIMDVEHKNFVDHHIADARDANTLNRATETCQTLHLSALSYDTVGGDLSRLVTLESQYRLSTESEFTEVLERLFNHTLAEWQRVRLFPSASMKPWLENRINCAEDSPYTAKLDAFIQRITEQAGLYDVVCDRIENKLIFTVDAFSVALTEPLVLLERGIDFMVPFSNTSGSLSGKNILTNGWETWLTNFLNACGAPSFRDVVAMEAILRYDWTDQENTTELLRFECELTSDRPIEDGFSQSSVKTARMISLVRSLAGIDVVDEPYLLCLFYHTLSRILEAQVTDGWLKSEVFHYLRCLVSCAALAQRVLGEGLPGQRPESTFRFEGDGKTVIIDDLPIKLSPPRLLAFSYLHKNLGQPVHREELFQVVWPDKDFKKADIALLVFRLRKHLKTKGITHDLIVTEGDCYKMGS